MDIAQLSRLKAALYRLLPTGMALAFAAFALSFAPPKTVGPPWLLALLAVLTVAWVLTAPVNSQRDDVLPAIAVVLASIGLLLVARISPLLAHKQQYWLLISLALATLLGPALTLFVAWLP